MNTQQISEKPVRVGGRIKTFMRRKAIFVVALSMAALALCVSAYKFREGEIDYRNSDATWHTLLTIEAYNETPMSDHLFLPLVSLGREEDKYIPWGGGVPDKNGNYYYISFSPAGYALPWLFMKVLSLPVNEKSLYLFTQACSCCLRHCGHGLFIWCTQIRGKEEKKFSCYR